jgi:NAD(P) transhydrogenase subunit alpha
MIIGVPKEIMLGEDRVSSSPATVTQMVKDGLTVLVEEGAGEGAFYHDDAYREAGAEIVSSASDHFYSSCGARKPQNGTRIGKSGRQQPCD